MKTLIALAASVACLVAVIGCDKAPSNHDHSNGNSPSAQGSVAKKKLSYEFTEVGCTTGIRHYSNLLELCLGLQIEQLNNNCALVQRKSSYATNCSNFGAWDAAAAEVTLKESNGHYVECIFSEEGAADISQFSSQFNMLMEQKTTNAFITQGLKDGHIGLRMIISDKVTGQEIAAVQKNFQDETRTVDLEASQAVGHPRLSCRVTVTRDARKD